MENVTLGSDVCGSVEKTLPVLTDLSDFVFKRVLSLSLEGRKAFVEGTFAGKSDPVVLIFEKEPFEDNDFINFFSTENKNEKVFQNDIYSFFRYLPISTCNGIKITSIYPATQKHIDKYSHQPIYIINETPELYHSFTLPCIQSENFSLDWVYNILEHKSETERIVFEDSDAVTGFVLLPDLKWDGTNLETLYLLALPLRRGIMSLRDLTNKELPLLNNIYDRGVKAIEEKYGLPQSKLRVYLHYQPSFYHLHVHFTFLHFSPPGINSERAHLLKTVINNISLKHDYYQLATIPFALREADKLFEKFESGGVVERTSLKND